MSTRRLESARALCTVRALNTYFGNGKINSNFVYENLPRCTFPMSTSDKDQLVPPVAGSKNEVMAFKYSTLNSNDNIDIDCA